MTGRERGAVCSGCSKAIDLCAFCERADCGNAVCYMCLVIGLDESKPVLRELDT